MTARSSRRDPEDVCRVCGCTDSQACTWFEVLGDGRTERHACHWVAPGLCSACAQPTLAELESFIDREPPPEPLLFDAAGRPLVLR